MKRNYIVALFLALIPAGCDDSTEGVSGQADTEVPEQTDIDLASQPDIDVTGQAACGGGVQIGTCREYAAGAIWKPPACPNGWGIQYWPNCNQYQTGSIYYHLYCSTSSSYLCVSQQYPPRPLPGECCQQCTACGW